MRSFVKLQHADLGIDAKNVLTFRVGLPPAQYKDEKVVRRFFDQLIPKLAAIPGVESAGAVSSLPVTGQGVGGFIVEGEAQPKALQDARISGMLSVTPGYFRTFGIPLVRGRDFAAVDDVSKPLVVVIDELAARTLFPNQDPIGKRICKLGPPNEPAKWYQVVGVVRTVLYNRLTSKRTLPTMYFAEPQETEQFMSVALRTKNAPASFANLARNAVLSVNKDIPIYKVKLMTDVVKESYWERRFFGTLFTAFSILALFLASIGLYGVMSYSGPTANTGDRCSHRARRAGARRPVARHARRLALDRTGPRDWPGRRLFRRAALARQPGASLRARSAQLHAAAVAPADGWIAGLLFPRALRDAVGSDGGASV